MLTFTDPNNTQLGEIFVFTQAIGNYQTGTEYWSVNQDALAKLGQYNLSFAYADSSSTSPPSYPAYTPAARPTAS